MEETQVMNFDETFDESDLEEETFHIGGWIEINKKRHELREGSIKIGRDPSTCKIVIENEKTLSKEHAVLEIDKTCVTLMDLGSRNKTRIGKIILKPHVRYALQGGEKIKFGAVPGLFITNKQNCHSDSDTCSESVLSEETPSKKGVKHLNESTDDSVISPTPQISTKNISKVKTSKTVNEYIDTDKDSSSLLISPTPSSKVSSKFLNFQSKESSLKQFTVIPETPAHCSRRIESPVSQSTPFTSYVKSMKGLTPLTPPTFLSPISVNNGKNSKDNNSHGEASTSQTCNGENFVVADQKYVEKEDIENYNTDESTDTEDFFAPETHKMDEKKCDDITTMPTQIFSKENVISKVDNDGDDTQDILKAFNDGESVEVDNTQDVLQAFEECTQKPEVDDISEVATQHFDKTDSGTLFKRPFACAVKTKQLNEKPEGKNVDIFEAPTQIFNHENIEHEDNNEDIFDMPTQVFHADSYINENKDVKSKSDICETHPYRKVASSELSELSELPTQIFDPSKDVTISSSKFGDKVKSNVVKSLEKDASAGYSGGNMQHDDDNENIFDMPTQVFNADAFIDKNKDVKPNSNICETPAQVFDSPDQEVGSSKQLSELPTQIFEAPTQIFDPSKDGTISSNITGNELRSDNANSLEKDASPGYSGDKITSKDIGNCKNNKDKPILEDLVNNDNSVLKDEDMCETIPFSCTSFDDKEKEFEATQKFEDEDDIIASSCDTFKLEDSSVHTVIENVVTKKNEKRENTNEQGGDISDTDSEASEKLLPDGDNENLEVTQKFSYSDFSELKKVGSDKMGDESDEEGSTTSEPLLQEDHVDVENLEPTQKFSYSLLISENKDKSCNPSPLLNEHAKELLDESNSKKLNPDADKSICGDVNSVKDYNTDESTDVEEEEILKVNRSRRNENKVKNVSSSDIKDMKENKLPETSLKDHTPDEDESLEPTQKFSYSMLLEKKDITESNSKLNEEYGNDCLNTRNLSKLNLAKEKSKPTGEYNSDENTDVEEEEDVLPDHSKISKSEMKNVEAKDIEERNSSKTQIEPVNDENLESTQIFSYSLIAREKNDESTEHSSIFNENQRKYSLNKDSSKLNPGKELSHFAGKTNFTDGCNNNKNIDVEEIETIQPDISESSKNKGKVTDYKESDQQLNTDVNVHRDSSIKNGNKKDNSLDKYNSEKIIEKESMANISVVNKTDAPTTSASENNLTDDGDLSKLELTGNSSTLSMNAKTKVNENPLIKTPQKKENEAECAIVDTSEFSYSCLDIDWSGIPSDDSMSPAPHKKKSKKPDATPDNNSDHEGSDTSLDEANVTGKSQALFDLPSDSDISSADDDIREISPLKSSEKREVNEQNILLTSSVRKSKGKNSASKVVNLKISKSSEKYISETNINAESDSKSPELPVKRSRRSRRNEVKNNNSYSLEKDNSETKNDDENINNYSLLNNDNKLNRRSTRGNLITTDKSKKNATSKNNKLAFINEEYPVPSSSSTPVKRDLKSCDSTSMNKSKNKPDSNASVISEKLLKNTSKSIDSGVKNLSTEDVYNRNKKSHKIQSPILHTENITETDSKSIHTTRRGRRSAAPSRYSPSKNETSVIKKMKASESNNCEINKSLSNEEINVNEKSSSAKRSLQISEDLIKKTTPIFEKNVKKIKAHNYKSSTESLEEGGSAGSLQSNNTSGLTESSKKVILTDKSSSTNKTKVIEDTKPKTLLRATRTSKKLLSDNMSTKEKQNTKSISNVRDHRKKENPSDLLRTPKSEMSTRNKSKTTWPKDESDKNLKTAEVANVFEKKVDLCNEVMPKCSPAKNNSKNGVSSRSTRSTKSSDDSLAELVVGSRRNAKSKADNSENISSLITKAKLKEQSHSDGVCEKQILKTIKTDLKVNELDNLQIGVKSVKRTRYSQQQNNKASKCYDTESLCSVSSNSSFREPIKRKHRGTEAKQQDKDQPEDSDDTASLCSVTSDSSFREPTKRKLMGKNVKNQEEDQPVRKSRRTNKLAGIENEVEINTAHELSSSGDSQKSIPTISRRSRLKHNKTPSPAKSTRSKRSRASSPSFSEEQILWSPAQRQNLANKHPRVLFTTFKDSKDEKIVIDAGGKIAESPSECTVLVTNAVKRTCKLLACVAKGVPVVSTHWLVATKRAKCFVDPWEFIISDVESEKKFGFTMLGSLKISSKKKLFSDYSFHVTDSVKPPPNDMREIIECAGGEYLEMPPKFAAPKTIIVSCEEDKKKWNSFKILKLTIVDKEFILTGLLRQKIMLQEYRIL